LDLSGPSLERPGGSRAAMKRFRSHCDAVRMVCQFRRGPSEGLNYSKSRKRMATITGNSRGWGALATRGRTSYRRLPSQSSQDQPARVAHSRYRQTAVQQELASAREQPIFICPASSEVPGPDWKQPPSRPVCDATTSTQWPADQSARATRTHLARPPLCSSPNSTRASGPDREFRLGNWE